MNPSLLQKSGFLLCYFSIVIGLSLSGSLMAQTIRYVRADGTNSNPVSATSWATATRDLQGAINSLNTPNSQVWVAAGTYMPTNPSGLRTVSYGLKNGVTVYGGFPATGTPGLADRSPLDNPSTLSGDIGTPGSTTDNSYHVISNNNLNNTAVLDGFVIQRGNADGSGTNRFGGGMYNVNSSPTILNCYFSLNNASSGGGLNNDTGSSPQLINCSFSRNSASNVGGGLSNFASSPQLLNCLFVQNSASSGGAIANNTSSHIQIINCSIVENSASTAGGGISNTASSTVTLSSSIVWNNGGGNTLSSNSSILTARYCLFDNTVTGYSGTTNIATATSPFVGAGSLTLRGCSPAVNGGDPTSITSPTGPYSTLTLPPTDGQGNPRIDNGRVDMGATEFQGPSMSITSQPPASRSVCEESIVTVSIGVSGAGPFTYTWFKNNTLLPGQTSDRITYPDALTSMAGTYIAVVTDGCLSLTTTPFTLTVIPLIRYYVKPGGTGNGHSWATAMGNLQTAIDATCAIDVWVAAGLYRPSNSDRAVSFTVRSGVNLVGGFAGTETDIEDRPVPEPTKGQPSSSTLSGEIGDPSSSTDNSYHVISLTGGGIGPKLRLNGFVITGGYANGGGLDEVGAGILNLSSDLFVQDCLFIKNKATAGGAISNAGGSHRLFNCSFVNNTSELGGAVFNENSEVKMTDCVFQSNTALSSGGGMINYEVGLSLNRCVFDRNVSYDTGGGLSNNQTDVQLVGTTFRGNIGGKGGAMYSNDNLSLALNCAFINNRALDMGGGLFNTSSAVLHIGNCSFQRNTSDASLGGAIANIGSSVTAINTILWNNNGNAAIYNPSGSNTRITYSLLDSQLTGYTDPSDLIATESPFSSTTSVVLTEVSAAINTGDPATQLVPNGNTPYSLTLLPTTDLLNNPRVVGGRVDMGAVEDPVGPVISLLNGIWQETRTWQGNRVPNATDTVILRHSVSFPNTYQAQAKKLRFLVGGQLVPGNGKLRLGF